MFRPFGSKETYVPFDLLMQNQKTNQFRLTANRIGSKIMFAMCKTDFIKCAMNRLEINLKIYFHRPTSVGSVRPTEIRIKPESILRFCGCFISLLCGKLNFKFK